MTSTLCHDTILQRTEPSTALGMCAQLKQPCHAATASNWSLFKAEDCLMPSLLAARNAALVPPQKSSPRARARDRVLRYGLCSGDHEK